MRFKKKRKKNTTMHQKLLKTFSERAAGLEFKDRCIPTNQMTRRRKNVKHFGFVLSFPVLFEFLILTSLDLRLYSR